MARALFVLESVIIKTKIDRMINGTVNVFITSSTILFFNLGYFKSPIESPKPRSSMWQEDFNWMVEEEGRVCYIY